MEVEWVWDGSATAAHTLQEISRAHEVLADASLKSQACIRKIRSIRGSSPGPSAFAAVKFSAANRCLTGGLVSPEWEVGSQR